MMSINPILNSLHDAYCRAMCIELPMSMTHERWWHSASLQGVSPDDVTICIEQRLKFNRSNTFKRGLMIHHLVRSEEDIAVLMNEVAVFKASQRIRVMDPGKASVFRATHRPDAVPTPDAVPVADVKLIQDLRKAAQ